MQRLHQAQKRTLLGICGAVGAFWLLDFSLRVFSGSGAHYALYMPAPNLFSLGWGALFAGVCLLAPRRAGRVLYGVIYAFWAVYTLVQCGCHRLFDRFLFLSDFAFAGEGLDFASFATELVDARFMLLVLAALAWGALGVWALPDVRGWKMPLALLGGFALTQVLAPLCLSPAPAVADWDAWQSSGYEYSRFSSSGFAMAITGPYQFVARDAYLAAKGQDETALAAARDEIDAYFAEQPAHRDNAMTGLLRGKNLILVQLESIDDFVLNDENTPTLARLQREGICFSEFYTPQYANGYTFNTEFAANTGIYPFANGNAAYSLGRSAFPDAMASLFSDAGYTAQSFHKSEKQFYNRGEMHQAFGYAAYHSALDYAPDERTAGTDRFLAENDMLWAHMTESTPFFDFLITYSGHLGYDEKDELTTYALSQYPQYLQDERPYEISGLFAKARLTDELLETLLARLEQDSLLKDTVLIVYDDHYAYGLTDEEILQEYSAAAGGRLLERTPAFIWYQGVQPQTVGKTLQTVDLLPTIANLFGLPAPRTMGRDAFDPNYEGIAIFPDGTWLNGTTYVEKGAVRWNEGMDAAQIEQMTAEARRFVRISELILQTDNYREAST